MLYLVFCRWFACHFIRSKQAGCGCWWCDSSCSRDLHDKVVVSSNQFVVFQMDSLEEVNYPMVDEKNATYILLVLFHGTLMQCPDARSILACMFSPWLPFQCKWNDDNVVVIAIRWRLLLSPLSVCCDIAHSKVVLCDAGKLQECFGAMRRTEYWDNRCWSQSPQEESILGQWRVEMWCHSVHWLLLRYTKDWSQRKVYCSSMMNQMHLFASKCYLQYTEF